ncbi:MULTISPECIES: phosphopantetheine-binding protein [Streptomyces]|uniref:phosphopantetheine-binding protein n=1 Tax=Streptomyces TaxID=1883 RepID=UPI001F27F352|nr:phosphopantetheine-binding protein [Streptomyces olivochromogenes]MCF3137264.1 acyl carrier protein [Streptomyces olivochromogenes]
MWDDQFEGLIRPHLGFLPEDAPFTKDLDLRDAGLDSLGIVDLLIEIENAYDVKFTDDALSMETFSTPDALWRTLSGLRAAAVN